MALKTRTTNLVSHSSTDRSPEAAVYFLRTQRLGFRTWTEADLDLAFGLWGDAEVTRLIGGPFSEERIQQRLAQIANQATLAFNIGRCSC
jgi:RimJ/RimL family protein N-acetyltransferase